MKYALSILLVTILGFAEYVYVEVMPLPEHRRLGRLIEVTHAETVVQYWMLHKFEAVAEKSNPWESPRFM